MEGVKEKVFGTMPEAKKFVIGVMDQENFQKFRYMKKLVLIVTIITASLKSWAQPETEIYVFDLVKSENGFTISNPVNITYENPGYDNQPYFKDDLTLLYVSTDKGQTDVAEVELKEYSWTWYTRTPGSEYSPTPTPDNKGFSSINLEKDGTQLLWKYFYDFSAPKVLVPDLIIGYHTWLNENELIAFVLGDTLGNPNTLQRCNLKTEENQILTTEIGRSLHNIPKSSSISFVDKKAEDDWWITSYDPLSAKFSKICKTLPGQEDYAWHPDGVVFMGNNDLYYLDANSEKSWKQVILQDDKVLNGITRISINPSGTKIAIVVNE